MKTERTRLRREHHKGSYDKDKLYALLDTLHLCNIAFIDNNQPYSIPTLQWREGDYVYWHGSTKSRAIMCSNGTPVCLTATNITGLVLARSAFEHTANFESLMVLGIPELISDEEEKRQHLKVFMESLFPGRDETLRPMTQLELKATAVMRLRLEEASIKIREGEPNEPEADRTLPIWAGVIPISLNTDKPIPDSFNQVPLPDYLKSFVFLKKP